MKKKTIVLSAGLGLGICLASGLSFFNFTVRRRKPRHISKHLQIEPSQMKVNHPRHHFKQEYEEGKAWCMAQSMQDCCIKSFDALTLHGFWFPAQHPVRTVMLCHGYRGSGFGDFAYTARFLHENGCNLLFIDQRCCGQSEGTYITFGAKEQFDVQTWAWYLVKRSEAQLPIYLYGESMGATSVLLAAGRELPREVRGLIVDCGFRSMRWQLQEMAKNWFHLPRIGFLLLRLEILCRLLADFRMKDTDTTQAVLANKRPVLFFHGLKDTYVPPENTLFHHKLCCAPKELVLIPEARHLCVPYQDPELVRGRILAFFDKYDRYGKNNDPPA